MDWKRLLVLKWGQAVWPGKDGERISAPPCVQHIYFYFYSCLTLWDSATLPVPLVKNIEFAVSHYRYRHKVSLTSLSFSRYVCKLNQSNMPACVLNDVFQWPCRYRPQLLLSFNLLCFPFYRRLNCPEHLALIKSRCSCNRVNVCKCVRVCLCVCLLIFCVSVSLPAYTSVFSFLFLQTLKTHWAQPGATVFLTKCLVKDPTTVAQERSLLNQTLPAP